MSECLIGFPLTAVTYSGGSYETLLPITNASTTNLAAVARTTNADAASTVVRGDQGSAKAVSVIAVKRHNLQASATWRIRLSANADLSSPSYDTGAINCWPEQWATGVLPAGHPNASTRRFTNADIAALNPKLDLVHVLSTEITARYLGIDFVDTGNTAGYVEFAQLLVAPAFGIDSDFGVGAEIGANDNTLVTKVASGGRYYDDRPVGRTFTGLFPIVSQDQGAMLQHFSRSIRQSGQCYFVFDRSDTVLLQQRSFLANQRQLSAVQYAAAGTAQFPLAFDEVI